MNDSAITPLRARTTYHGLLLGAICLCMTLALLIGFRLTKTAIDQAAQRDRLAKLAQVLPPALYDNDPTQDTQVINDPELSDHPVEVFLAKHQGILSGIAFQVVRPGYAGPITLLVGLDTKGDILGVRVLEHKETPGLGDHIDVDKDTWITRFNGHSLSNTSTKAWHVKKDGGDFDQFTGATITPRAVVGAIHQALLFDQRHFLQGAAAPQAEGQAHE